MGNKNSRERSHSDAGDDPGQRRRRKPASRSQSASQVDAKANRLSMPELGGAVPYKPRDEVDIDVTVYRSYGDLARPKSTTLDQPDFKVYRKSADPVEKYATLPRHFGRSRSAAAAADVPNGTMRDYDMRKRNYSQTPDYPEIMPRRRSPPESLSSESQRGESSQRTSKRVSAASSLSSLARAPVSQDDFPITSQVKRKLKCFEDQFCRSLADKYAGLADTLQLSALPIALARGRDGEYRHIKLLDYLQGETIPLDLLNQDPEQYVIIVPDALLHGIMHVRRDKISDLALWTTLARDLVTCIGVEAACDISRMFEYQIALLAGDSAVRVLADHAAACVIEYVKKQSSYLDRNTAVIGVIRGQPSQGATGAPKYLSVILGNRELKWEVREVLKRPGLRKELYLFSSTVDECDGLYSPWHYFTSKDCNPQVYGYRSIMLEWDWIERIYKVNEQDMAMFTDDISDLAAYPDDFHRMYSPYKVLCGGDVMMKYCELKAKNKTQESLAQFLTDATGGERDEIQPVYRPLVAPPDGMDFNTMNLDNVDLTRARLRRADLSQASIKNCKLLLTDLEGAQFKNMERSTSAQLTGTDVSYTNLVPSTMDQATLEGMTAKHVVVVKPKAKKKKQKSQLRQEDHNGHDDGIDQGVDTMATDPLQIETTPVTAKPRKKKRRVPKTLNIETEINGHTETTIDDSAVINGEMESPVDMVDYVQGVPGSPVEEDVGTEAPYISDSQGNLLEIEQVIEQKQQKIRERKKKTKKRPVGPIASTPTEPIPETPVFVQEQFPSYEQVQRSQPPEVKPIQKDPETPIHVQEAVDQTEEFFKESKPQYEPEQYHSPPQYNQVIIQAPEVHQAEPSTKLVNGSRGDDKGNSDAPLITVTQADEETEKSKTKKKTKKGDKSKGEKTKGDKKRKKSRSKTPETEPSPAEAKEELHNKQKTPNGKSSGAINGAHFDAIDATPVNQNSPAKALSTTDIHQQHSRNQGHHGHSQDQVLYPRMTKSLSHHGNLTTGQDSKLHNLSLDSYGLGLRTARQIYGLSKEEIEYITRSQIFNMIKGLQIENVESNLPEIDKSFVGRVQEVDDVSDLLSSSGRIVTLTGCYGNGKSSLATAVGHEVNKKFVVPIVIEVRGCLTAESVTQRMVETFGLHFRYKELNFFYNWLNCHEQRFLFIFDNLDISLEEDNNFSNLLDNIMRHVKDLRILFTSRRHFFKGISTHEVYRLGNAEQFSMYILKDLLPDLHDEGLDVLLEVCAHNPYILNLVSKVFTMDEVDSGKLFEELVETVDHALLNRVEVTLSYLTHDEGELEILRRLVVCVLKVLDNIPLGHAELLQKASHFTSSFDAKTMARVAERKDIADVESALVEMEEVGLVIGAPDKRYYLPSLIKLVNHSKIDERGSDNLDYYRRVLDDIKLVCAKYHSKNCKEAVQIFYDNYDNYVHVFNKVIEREDTYEFCPSFASLEYALFLSELLPEEVYINFYESFAQESEENNNIMKQCRALCCLSHRLAMEDSVSAAKHAVDKAYDLVHANSDSMSETETAFCLRCMAKIVWENEEDRARALLLVKKSLDLYKLSLGAKDIQTIHTNEMYARMLTQKESYQTARHFYNISDLFVTEMINGHPLIAEGYNCRRLIWDGLCLFQRATDMATKAVEVSKEFYGEHPLTARMLSNLCDAIIKRGSLNDAIKAGIEALSIRSKVLGDHIDTGESYKKLAYLMLRSGQYDEAARFGQSAMEVFDKVNASETQKFDVRNVIAQARLRLEYKSHVFVELQGRDANKKHMLNGKDDVNANKTTPTLHTEV